MLNPQAMTVLIQDRANRDIIPNSKLFQVLYPSDVERLESARNLFIFTSMTQLSEVADIVRTANNKHHLKALFIREDIDPKWLPQMFKRANLRTLQNAIVHVGSEIPKRVINAWKMEAQSQLIANATVIGDRLLVVSCEMEALEVSFQDIPALQQIPSNEREDFIISEEGSYLYWSRSDIHLDLSAFRSVVDSTEKQKFEILKANHDKLFGKAIATLREKHKLRQSDISGLSERQVRRIERGEGTKVETLNLLAKAHGMDLDTYLNEVANLVENFSEKLLHFANNKLIEAPLKKDELLKLMGTEEQAQIIEKTVPSECHNMEECN